MILFLGEVGNIEYVNAHLQTPVGKWLGVQHVIKVLFRHFLYCEYPLPLVIPPAPVHLPPVTPTHILSIGAIRYQCIICSGPSILQCIIYIPQNFRLEVAVIDVGLSKEVPFLVLEFKVITSGVE